MMHVMREGGEIRNGLNVERVHGPGAGLVVYLDWSSQRRVRRVRARWRRRCRPRLLCSLTFAEVQAGWMENPRVWRWDGL